MKKPELLLIDDNSKFLGALATALEGEFATKAAYSADEARHAWHPPPNAIVLDLRLDESQPERMEGTELLGEIVQEMPHVPVIILTAHGDVETAVQCMRTGAADFIVKGGNNRELLARISKAIKMAQISREYSELSTLVEPRRLLGDSAGMLRVRELIGGAALDGEVTVLITGETGTGKELVARAIHASGTRAQQPFVAVAVTALPATTLESELFGYEPGAFTDARKRHIGYFERAHGGVLFLDEIGDLEISLQVKLLRFLEERVITRLGGSEEVPIDVQVVAATNADLSDRVQRSLFRPDLLYRLQVYSIPVPPLRQRKDDVALLSKSFLAQARRGRSRHLELSASAIRVLHEFNWPGNIRQLKHAIESAVLQASLARRDRIEPADLPDEITHAGRAPSRSEVSAAPALQQPISLDRELARQELVYVKGALEATGNNKTEAASLLGLNDRFALRRRVLAILKRHPELGSGFPDITGYFGPRKRLPSSK
jgi:two-component system, NtrC family, response regulator AtoC